MYITYILTYMYFFFRFFFIIGYYKTLKWQPTPAFLPGKSLGRKSLAGYTVHGVAKSGTQLSDFIFFLLLQDTESKIQRYTVGPCCFINCSVYLLIPNF